MGDGCLPSGGFGSLYNQNHNNDDDYQKKEGGYNDGPPHGLQKSSCEKKNAYVLFQCYAIMHIRSRKSAKYETILLRNHWITRETRTLCVDIYTVKAVVYERSLFHFYFEVVGFMGQPPIMQYYTTLHGINDYLRMNDHLHRIHRRIHSQMTLLYSRKSHADRSHLGESRTR